MGNKILIMILATFTMMASAFADHHEEGAENTEKKPFSIYGDFAGSVLFKGNENEGNTTSRHDDFNVDLVELNVEKNWSHSKLHLSIGYGDTAVTFNPTNTQTLNVINAYYEMQSSYGLGFKFGKFESPIGYESFNHMDNTLFTRSYGYSDLIPQLNTGLGLTYGFGPMVDVGFYIVNGAEKAYPDNNNNKTMILTVGVNPMENLSFDINYMTGVDGAPAPTDVLSNVLEVTAAYTVNEMINLGLDYTAKSTETRNSGTKTEQDASSIAAYVNGNFGMFGAALRYEMLADDKAGMLITTGAGDPTKDNTINAITLGVHTEIDQNARVIVEYRTESADEKVWTDKDGKSTDSQDMITLGMMYRF